MIKALGIIVALFGAAGVIIGLSVLIAGGEWTWGLVAIAGLYNLWVTREIWVP